MEYACLAYDVPLTQRSLYNKLRKRIRQVRQLQPDLILLDLNLGKLGGLHVLRQLKSDELTKSIPIVVLTSSKLAIELVESYKFGVNSYVIKPTDSEKFAQVVASIGHYWLVINEPPP